MDTEGHQRQHPSAPLRIVREGSAKISSPLSIVSKRMYHTCHIYSPGLGGLVSSSFARFLDCLSCLVSCLRPSVFCVSVYLSFLVLSDSNGFGCSNISIPSATAPTLTPFSPVKPDFASSSCIPRHRMVARVSTFPFAFISDCFSIPFQARVRL